MAPASLVTNAIGIVQGRLSPPVAGRLQAFPWETWQDEFARARAAGYSMLEWVFESDRYDENPIWTPGGRARIRQLAAKFGVAVPSLCADYFMTHPFFRVPDAEREASGEVLCALVAYGADVGMQTILVPVLEVSEIRSARDKADLLDSLRRPLDLAAAHGVRLGLETELPAREYRALVEGAAHPALAAYYDVGNATARGFDVAADLRVLAPVLCGVHLKDRQRGGPSVKLGHGHADFAACFDALAHIGYDGPLILQPATSEDYLEAAREHARFVEDHLKRVSAHLG